jgi:hypothetical protein
MKRIATLAVISIIAGLYAAAVPSAQGSVGVIAMCDEKGGCRISQIASWTAGGQKKIRLAPEAAARDSKLLQNSSTVKTDSLLKLYRNPQSGEIRALPQTELVLPAKIKGPAAISTIWDGLAIEFKDTLKSKSTSAMPIAQFVAIVMGETAEDAALVFIRDLTNGVFLHPRKKELIVASLEIAGRSSRLGEWRAELINLMKSSLADFRAEKGDPRKLEQLLQSGLEAMEIFRLISPEGNQEAELQKALTDEYRELKRGMAAAAALMKSGFHDAYLAKLEKIGLARWIQPEVGGGVAAALKASATQHHEKALELEKGGQLGKAFDEAQIASERIPCDSAMAEHFYKLRAEYVTRNMVPMAAQLERSNLTSLEQIVRELEGIRDDSNLDEVRIDYFRKRIEEGLRIDKSYLPLQLRRADFLSRIGKLAESQSVVVQVERDYQLTKQDSDAWLRMDAGLKERQATTRQRSENDARSSFESGKFTEALGAAERGLKADPENPGLMSYAARAAAVLRDDKKAQEFARSYLRDANSACVSPNEGLDAMIALFDHKSAAPATPAGDSGFPHWISGKRYRLEDVNYDPLSGGFFQQVRTIMSKDRMIGSTISFQWDGFAATSIEASKSIGNAINKSESVVFELEPKYRREFVYMSEIGMKANSSGDRAAYPLLYLNSPDFDPTLAEKYSKKTFTRGWAGNPFFHPFLWTGIFLFDLTYDTQGRIIEARPVYPDTSRPRSPFSEVLKFKWEDTSNRLISITGRRYSRAMTYDSLGRLVQEKIAFEKGRGKIDYKYKGKSRQIQLATCEDNFFDKTERLILFRDFTE